jgi:hypothetical protein
MPLDDTERHCERTLDLLALDRVTALLDTPDKWCKRQLRSSDGRRCLMGAMMEAGGGSRLLKAPILLAAKQITGRTFANVEVFNDQESTTHETVMRVLAQTRINILYPQTEPPRPFFRRIGLFLTTRGSP